MDEKIYIQVLFSPLQRSFDFVVPSSMRLFEVVKLIAGIINNVAQMKYMDPTASFLCDLSTGDVLNNNLTIQKLGIKNGEQLMII